MPAAKSISKEGLKLETKSELTKVMIYDFDRGLKSLADDDRIEQVFGYKPRRFIRTNSIWTLFDKIHRPQVITTTDPLGDVQEEVYFTTADVDIEVLDAITSWQSNKKREVKGDAERISLPMWGEIGETLEELILKLTRTDTDVIIFGHTKSEKDDDAGIIRKIAAVSGRMQNEIGRAFDLVLFTDVTADKENGARTYRWQVIADQRASAKSRIEEISEYAQKNGGYLPQDFALLFELAHKYPAIKILILGDSGTGKTYSLRTLRGLKRKRPASVIPVAAGSVVV